MDNISTADIIYKIECECFSEPWSWEMIKSQLENPNTLCVVKEYNNSAVGYVIGVKMGEESEIYRIAVLPEFRRMGAARELLSEFIRKCSGVVFLEVRSKNKAAISFYEAMGFVLIGKRKRYYGDDDALIYRLGVKVNN